MYCIFRVQLYSPKAVGRSVLTVPLFICFILKRNLLRLHFVVFYIYVRHWKHVLSGSCIGFVCINQREKILTATINKEGFRYLKSVNRIKSLFFYFLTLTSLECCHMNFYLIICPLRKDTGPEIMGKTCKTQKRNKFPNCSVEVKVVFHNAVLCLIIYAYTVLYF